MSDPIETIEISDEWRIAVYRDTDSENPRVDMDGWVTTFLPARSLGYGPSEPDLYTDEIGLGQALRRMRYRDAERWALSFHETVIEWDAERHGFWYCTMAGAEACGIDWPLSREKQQEQITAERATYEQWAHGDVYQVDLEQKARYVRVDRNDEPVFLADDLRIERWEYVQGIGGCYLDDDYTAIGVAVEHFEVEDILDDEEREKLEELANEDRQRREERGHHDRPGGDQLRAGGEAAGGPSAPADAGCDGEAHGAVAETAPRRDDPLVPAGTDRLGRAQGGERR